jgi:hypothetical protein
MRTGEFAAVPDVVPSHQELPLLATRFLNTYKIVVGGRLRSIFPPCPNIRSLCIAALLYMFGTFHALYSCDLQSTSVSVVEEMRIKDCI